MVTICTAQWSQLCTTSLTFTHSTFCPHGVFVCFVLIWEQTAIISLYGISWLVCITDYMYRTMVTICTTSLTFTHSTFCPHSVFVSIWEPTSIISLHNINWLVCVTETECVYCAERTGSLYTILRSAHTVYLCVLCGSENKQRLFPYTALTDWFV